MNISGLIFLLAVHFLTGRGVLGLFKIKGKLTTIVPLSFIVGVVLVSMVPMVLEMCHIDITTSSVIVAVSLLAASTSGLAARNFDFKVWKKISVPAIRLYEWIFIILFVLLMLPSVWRCYYYPPSARDVLSGPEPIAEFTVREHTMINSALTVDLTGTNNHLKPPFVSGLQIVYKLLVHPFGQLWLTVLVLSFLTWLYSLLRERVHPFIAGLTMLLFICMPDPYGYTYIILFDYSNMILFFAGVYYLSLFTAIGEKNILYFSALLFGLATFIRLETLVFCAMLVPVAGIALYNRQKSIPAAGLHLILFLLVPFAFYYIWAGIFLKHYMPGGFSLDEQVTHAWGNVGYIFTRMSEMNSGLLFASDSTTLYGHLCYVFLAVVLADALFVRKFSREARVMLYGIFVVYVGLALMGYITPLFDLKNTTKRGLYKMFPLMAIYLANSGLLQKLSAALYAFEHAGPREAQAQPAAKKVAVKKK